MGFGFADETLIRRGDVEYRGFVQCTDSAVWRSAVEMAVACSDFDYILVRDYSDRRGSFWAESELAASRLRASGCCFCSGALCTSTRLGVPVPIARGSQQREEARLGIWNFSKSLGTGVGVKKKIIYICI